MFVRWKKRVSRGNRSYNAWREVRDVTYSAFLVKCIRIDGKPRQKVIGFINSIHMYDLHREDWIGRNSRASFWYHAKRNMQKLALPHQEQDKVITSLAKVVPPLTEDEQKQWNEASERLRMVTGRGLTL